MSSMEINCMMNLNMLFKTSHRYKPCTPPKKFSSQKGPPNGAKGYYTWLQDRIVASSTWVLPPRRKIGDHAWEDICFWECAMYSSQWCFEKWIWVSHIVYIVFHWAHAQPSTGEWFSNIIAIYSWKTIDLQSMNSVHLQRTIVGNIFLYLCMFIKQACKYHFITNQRFVNEMKNLSFNS